MITIFSIDLLYFLSRLKSQFKNRQFQTSDLNLIKSKNTAFIKKNSSIFYPQLSTPHSLWH